jgi:putative ABC transport system permease protein
MVVISLSPLDLSIAACLVLLLALVSFRMKLGVTRPLIISGLRTTIQLLLIGFVLKTVFDHAHPLWLFLIGLMMVMVAGREVMGRQTRRFTGWWGFGIGATSMFLSSFSITLLSLLVIISVDPWYEPQYAIPLLGMLMGNTMNGIALGLERLTATAWSQRQVIEARLILGESWKEAIADIRKESVRGGMIPIINSMAVAGLVSLPGMMTGQILAGSPPVEAVKYQILIMFLIASGTGFGTMAAVRLGAHRLFDDRHRLRLDRLKKT